MDGAFILDKPEGITSHDAVMQVRRLLAEPHIGHLGTLDPFATGVLVLLLGKATRLARFYTDRKKTYEGTIRFGFSTDTYDRTGKPASPVCEPVLRMSVVRDAFAEFVGPQTQRPPAVSAKKVAGVPAYRLARKGQVMELAPVPVNVYSMELISFDGASAEFRASVSSGTYIRSLAHDIGTRLGCGAHLASLRRTSVGEFELARAMTIEQLQIAVAHNTVSIIHTEDLLPDIPSVALTPPLQSAVGHGNAVQINASDRWLRLLGQSGEVAAIAESIGGGLYQPRVVLAEQAEQR
jgi:tRNA pseudouridine55 synthase